MDVSVGFALWFIWARFNQSADDKDKLIWYCHFANQIMYKTLAIGNIDTVIFSYIYF